MKRQSFWLNACIILGLCCAAWCQSQPRQPRPFTVNVPFDFVIGSQHMPADNYTIRLLLNSVPGADPIEIASFHGKGLAYCTTVTQLERSERSEAGSRITFNRYGDRAFLSGISDGAREMIVRAAAREKELAPGQAKTETVLSGLDENPQLDSSAMHGRR